MKKGLALYVISFVLVGAITLMGYVVYFFDAKSVQKDTEGYITELTVRRTISSVNDIYYESDKITKNLNKKQPVRNYSYSFTYVDKNNRHHNIKLHFFNGDVTANKRYTLIHSNSSAPPRLKVRTDKYNHVIRLRVYVPDRNYSTTN